MSHSKAECRVLLERMQQDERIVVLAADVAASCGLGPVGEAFPQRVINVGIAEQNMLGIAAGLAHEGFLPFTHTFSAFSSMRSCEQLRTDIFYNDLNVKVIGTHGGVSTGPAGSTHFALEDMGILRSMPKSRLIVPADDQAAAAMTGEMISDPHPLYMRLDRNDLPAVYAPGETFPLGGSHLLTAGSDVAILAVGSMVSVALEAAALLEQRGVHTAVADMYSVKPLDEARAAGLAAECGRIVTLEEHYIIGGLGSAVAECLAQRGTGHRLLRLGLPDSYPMGGPVEAVRRRAGLTGRQVADAVIEWGNKC